MPSPHASTFLPFGGCLPMEKPNILQPAGKKDAKYAAEMFHALVSKADPFVINRMRAHGCVNQDFSSGNQWVTDEDVTTFLSDGSTKTNSRIMVTINMIKNAKEKHRATASKTIYTAEAIPITPRWTTRRDASRAQYLQMFTDAQSSPNMKNALSSFVPFGRTEQESALIHDNAYVDGVKQGVTGILKTYSAQESFNSPILHQREAADFFHYGITGTHFKVHQQHVKPELLRIEDFIWDTNAKEPDLSDAEFMGCGSLMNPTQIFERYDVSKEDRARIVSAASDNFCPPVNTTTVSTTGTNQNGNPIAQVFCMYWRDVSYQKFGYVMGENDVPELVCIDHIGPDDDPNEKPAYTEKDCIDPPNRPSVQRAFKGKKTRIKTVEVVRFVDILPWEYLLGSDNTQTSDVKAEDRMDIVLDHGVCELQEYDALETSSIKFPIKVVTWDMANGHIVAPCTDLISPQRLFNRSLAVAENQLAMSGGKALIIDADLLHRTEDPLSVGGKVKRGETILADTKGRGAPQVAHMFDSGMGTGAQALYQMMGQMLSMIRLVSGTPEALTATPTQDQGLGLNKDFVEQAQFLDEPFNASLGWLYTQKFQFVGTAVKDFMLRNPDVLYDMMSEEYVQALLASKNASLDQHRIAIARTKTDEAKVKEADAMLLGMRQLQLIDDERTMNLMGRATLDDVFKAGRDYQQAKALAMREAAKEEKKAGAMRNLAMNDAALAEKEETVYQDQVKATMQRADNADKSRLAFEREKARAVYEKPEPAKAA